MPDKKHDPEKTVAQLKHETAAELVTGVNPGVRERRPSDQAPTRGIGTFSIIMIGLGGVIGSGIFVASGIPVHIAGPAAIISYLIGALVVIPVMLYTGEMEAARPSAGAFSYYAQRYLNPLAGFVTGWMYWSKGVLAMATEVTAAALLVHWWLPAWPLWIFSLFFSLLISSVNLMDIRKFSRIEDWLASIKVISLIMFILFGLTVLTGLWPGLTAMGTKNYVAYGGFFPHGLKGIYASLLLVIFAYSGNSVVAMTAAQANDPARTIPRAVLGTGTTIAILYTGAILVLAGLLPWSSIPTTSSPFVTVLDRIQISFAGNLLNAIILTAVLSSMNTSMFGVTNMLRSLAERSEAPQFFLKTNRQGVPVRALAASAVFLSLAVILAYLLPQRVFLYVASASGFISLFNWTVTTLTYISFRKKHPAFRSPFTLPGYPYLPGISLFLLLATAASVPLTAGQLPGMISGLLLAVIYSAVFLLFFRQRNQVHI